MAEPNTLEWMTEQRDRLKDECDQRNREVDVLKAANLRMAGELMQLKTANGTLETQLSLANQAKKAVLGICQSISKLLPRQE